jgi:hypothetical protein
LNEAPTLKFEALERARKDSAVWAERIDEPTIRNCLELHFGKRYRLLDV